MNVASALINESVSLVANVVLFSSIPLIWHVVKEKTVKGFAGSLGIYKPSRTSVVSIVLTITPVYLVTLLANIMVVLLGYSGRSSGDTQGFTSVTLAIYLLLYGIKTGVAEEIFFRGFIAKNLFAKLGYLKGNSLQALVFALPHFVIAGTASAVDIVVRIVNAFLLGYAFGYVMYRRSGGSIIPVIIAHTLINTASSFVLLNIL